MVESSSSHKIEPKTEGYRYLFAAAPDIIRSNQKDAYFQGVLLENLSDVFRRVLGARLLHKLASEVQVLADLTYLVSTTLVGNRTLGEEYCDIIQVENDTQRLPSLLRRAAYIISTVLLPYTLTKVLPRFRSRLRSFLESRLQRSASKDGSRISRMTRVQSYVLDNLTPLTSTAPIYALSLAIFYFSGAYYHLGKRLFGLRYIFTRRIEPSDQRIGYEVLGLLLVLQMAVQAWLHVTSTLQGFSTTVANAGSLVGTSAVLEGGVEIGVSNPNAERADPSSARQSHPTSIEAHTHTPYPVDEARYQLKNQPTMAWIEGTQQRKCTLCLEELRDPSATTCGHVFCWTCIQDWIREKAECPLCRQAILGQHVLPLRG